MSSNESKVDCLELFCSRKLPLIKYFSILILNLKEEISKTLLSSPMQMFLENLFSRKGNYIFRIRFKFPLWYRYVNYVYTCIYNITDYNYSQLQSRGYSNHDTWIAYTRENMKQEITDEMRRYLFNECLNLDPLPLEADSSRTSIECKSVGFLDIV